jgi:hypothetical protein
MYQPPPLKVEFRLEDGSTHIYKVVKPLLGTEVLINRYIVSNQAFYHLMAGNYSRIPRIVSFKVLGEPSGFAPVVGIGFEIFGNAPVYRIAKAGQRIQRTVHLTNNRQTNL